MHIVVGLLLGLDKIGLLHLLADLLLEDDGHAHGGGDADLLRDLLAGLLGDLFADLVARLEGHVDDPGDLELGLADLLGDHLADGLGLVHAVVVGLGDHDGLGDLLALGRGDLFADLLCNWLAFLDVFVLAVLIGLGHRSGLGHILQKELLIVLYMFCVTSEMGYLNSRPDKPVCLYITCEL